MMFTRLREYWQDYKAWRRGEYRVGAYGSRGRVYARRDEKAPEAPMEVSVQTTYKTLARVIRVDGRPDEYYNLTEDRKLSPGEFSTLKGGTNHG